MKKIAIFFLTALLISASAISKEKASDRIDAYVKKYYESGKFNGVVFVADKGEIVYHKAYGFADFETRKPLAPDAKFLIGSITQQFTAGVALLMSQNDEIDLENTVQYYMPDYFVENDYRMKLRYLINHVSGIQNYEAFVNIDLTEDYTPRELIKLFERLLPAAEMGKFFHFSSLGYMLLGAILEEAAGAPYDSLLGAKILVPLELKNTGIADDSILRTIARQYRREGDTLKPIRYRNMTSAFCAGDMYSTAEDLYKWVQALESGAVFSKESRKFINRPYENRKEPPKEYFSCGWNYSKVDLGKGTQLFAFADGVHEGASCVISRVVGADRVIIILDNTHCGHVFDFSAPDFSDLIELGGMINAVLIQSGGG